MLGTEESFYLDLENNNDNYTNNNVRTGILLKIISAPC